MSYHYTNFIEDNYNCVFCECEFKSIKKTFVCKTCFNEPHSHQHFLHAVEKYRKETGLEIYEILTSEKVNKIVPLESKEIEKISKDIYGY